MKERQTMYRAFFSFGSLSMWHPESPVPEFHSSMELSDCGKYVEVRRQRIDQQGWETIREDINGYWQPTKAKALAVVAPRLRQIGERLIKQANDLEAAARAEEVVA